jgi:DNA polymerase
LLIRAVALTSAVRRVTIQPEFTAWRRAAKQLLAEGVPPEKVLFDDGSEGLLPGLESDEPPAAEGVELRLPRKFVDQLRLGAHHRDAERWGLLYRLVWRLTHEDRDLLRNLSDPDLRRLDIMTKAVRRCIHKTHAFVRFRKIDRDDGEAYVAWHRPDQLSLPLSAPFFRDRFGPLRWSILTPDQSVHWHGEGSGHSLCFTEGVPREEAPAGDALEELWSTYYAHIFNPARIKLKAMKAELPVRHWATLPEAAAIPDMLAAAPERVAKMVAATKNAKTKKLSAEPYLPESRALPDLRKAAQACEGCPLHEDATQVVFGQGPADAVCVFVGEQPGDKEDLAGKPFIGPAGQLMDDMLAAAGVDREQVYVTNTVKHFKHEQRGRLRLHVKPGAREITACKPWLEAELEAIRPPMLVALGATAAQALMGRTFKVTESRGEVMTEAKHAPWFMATIHPSAILRIPDDYEKARARQGFISDMRKVASQMNAELAKRA